MAKLIDTHCHPYFGHYDEDREEMLRRAFEVCEYVISVGSDTNESKKSIELATEHPNIFASVGIHPHAAETCDPNHLKDLLTKPKVVAIGECGLDFKPYGNQDINKDPQKNVFKAQINLANQANLPVIIHARDCWEDLLPLLKETPPRSGLIHSWTGGLKEANEIISLGLHISFSGMITYPANHHIRDVAVMAPADKILVETDAPFLPPQGLRGQRNEPGNVKMIASVLAEIRGVTLEEISAVTTANAKRLFKLS
ncbi:MAG TPA: TatD family hydrolase [Patescibacteria group bacterium]|nr:TatD family hydrolase [Patescibacteria group bacterium]